MLRFDGSVVVIARRPVRLSAAVLAGLFASSGIGCDVAPVDMSDASVADAAVLDAGPTCTVQLDDPTTLTTFPDRALLISDPTTETGWRLHYDPTRYSALTSRMGG